MIKIFKKNLLLTLFLVLIFVSHVFSTDENYIFEHIGRIDGLSNSSVSSIVQDKNGFLWFGTQGGINRFDGKNFKLYEHDPYDETSLSHRLIQTMYLDYENNVLWIGTYNGLSRFDIDTENFTHYKHVPDDDTTLSNEIVTAITKDDNGYIWAATLNGLNRLNPNTGEIKKYFASESDKHSISGNTVRSLLKDDKGNIWVGTLSGLNLYNRVNDSFDVYSSANHDIFKTDYIMALDEDDKGNIWIGNWGNGIIRFNVTNNEFELYETADNRIYVLKVEDNGSVWAGTWGGGLYEYNPEYDSMLEFRYDENNPGSLSHDTVYSILIDNSGLIWIGTNGNGINKLNRHKVDYRIFNSNIDDKNSIARGKVNSIHEDNDGNLWIGIYNGGLNKFDKDLNKIAEYVNDPDDERSLSNNIVTFIFEDSKNNLWFGTNEGLNKYNKEDDDFERYLPDGTENTIKGTIVYAMIEDKDHNFWIGYYKNGADYWDQETNKFVNYHFDLDDPNSLSDNLVYTIYEDSDDNIWIGTNNGLNKYDKKNDSFLIFRNNPNDINTISNNTVRTILEDSQENLWFGTSSGGINVLLKNSGKFTHYSKSNGLSDNAITAMIEDDFGNIWISTDYGISIYNPKTERFSHITERDGLWGMDFNTGHEKTKDGTLYFGSIHGIYGFKDTPEARNFHEPQVQIINIEVMNEPLITKQPYYNLKEITLPYNKNFISFEFIGIDYFSPEKNQYAYKLEGIDSEWIYSGNRNFVSYSNLSHGRYTFHIKAANNDGIWNNDGTSLAVIITPPPWQTWWAYCLYSLLAVFIVYLIILGINLKLKKESAESSSKAKTEFLANISHEVRTPLNSIIGFSTLLSETKVDDLQLQYLTTLKNSAHSLLDIINDILDISKIEAGKIEIETIRIDLPKLLEQTVDMVKYQSSVKGIELILNIMPSVPKYAYFDPVRLKQILLNLLNNAIKFTHEGEVELSVSFIKNNERSGKFSFSIRDTGIGISEEKQKKIFQAFAQADASTTRKYGGTGLGLFISNNFVNKMGGNIEINSKEENGSTFSFDLTSEFEGESWLKGKALDGTNKILFVGENFTLFSMLRNILSELGVICYYTNNTKEIPNILHSEKEIKYLIFDHSNQTQLQEILSLGMKIKNHSDLYETILMINPKDSDERIETSFNFSLSKPFKIEEFLDIFEKKLKQTSNTKQRKSKNIIHTKITEITPKILIVEDVKINRMLMITILNQIFQDSLIFEVENGKKALKAFDEEQFDIILMDIQMPELDGIEATKLIRKAESSKEIRTPIIALTAGAVSGEKERCINAGMDDFLTKPVNREVLKKTILKHLSTEQKIFEVDKSVNKRSKVIHFDKKQLMNKLENDEMTLKLLLDTAKKDIDYRIGILSESLTKNDFDTIRQEAHAIKGSSYEICLVNMGTIAKEIEMSAKEKQPEIKRIFEKLTVEWEIVKKEMVK